VLEPLPGELRLWPHTRLKALFAAPAARAVLAAQLAAHLGVEPQRIAARAVEDRVWEREWLKDFHAMRFGTRLWVSPHHEPVTEAQAVVVALDPGLAFGTGTHASTALCLTWLDAHGASGARVIDYGCGSGVLALAAAKLGARGVHCFDIDPQALLATRENAALNALGHLVHVHAHEDALPAGVELLLANILCSTLCTLGPRFAALVRPQGTALLAGILEHEVPEVTAAYAPCFDVAHWAARDGWVALSARRR
jgi:ribosomal protein L11 methyltransferase